MDGLCLVLRAEEGAQVQLSCYSRPAGGRRRACWVYQKQPVAATGLFACLPVCLEHLDPHSTCSQLRPWSLGSAL